MPLSDVVRDNYTLARVTLGLLFLCCAWAVATRSRSAGWSLAAVAACWFVVNRPIEGPSLLRLSWNHAVTLADALLVPVLALAYVVVGGPTAGDLLRTVLRRGRSRSAPGGGRR